MRHLCEALALPSTDPDGLGVHSTERRMNTFTRPVYIYIFDGNIYGNMSKVIKIYYLMLFDFKEYFL